MRVRREGEGERERDTQKHRERACVEREHVLRGMECVFLVFPSGGRTREAREDGNWRCDVRSGSDGREENEEREKENGN